MPTLTKVPFFSLEEQNAGLKSAVLGSIEAIIDKSDFILGEELQKFENDFADFCQTAACVGVSNGTAALYIALKALGVRTGDEVVIPAATFTSTALAVVQLGAVPVFADINPDTWLVDANSIASKLSPRTKAIIVVHLYGNVCAMDELQLLANNHNIALIEDCAQAHGATFKGKRVGGFGDMGCFSFYPSKNLGAMGDAGAVVLNNTAWVERLHGYRNVGKDHKGQFSLPGFNYRMNSFQAAILRLKLNYLIEFNRKRLEIARFYTQNIQNDKLQVQQINEHVSPVYHLFVIKADNRENFINHLEKNEIGYAIHYKEPVHLQGAFSDLAWQKGSLPISEDLYAKCTSIPLFPEMSQGQMQRVVDVINAY